MMHPNGLDLEAFACGEDVPAVAAHLASCDACRRYVEGVRAVAGEPLLPLPRPAPRRWAPPRALSFAALPAAAALLLWLAVPSAPGRGALPALPAAETAALSPGAPPPDPTPGSEGNDVRFKGRLQLAVVRERDGRQERFATPVRVRPGDRLRLELAVDEGAVLVAGVLGDDGAFVEVLAPGRRGQGSHLAERAVRVDDRPTSGYAMAGTVEAMENARRTGNLQDVTSIRLEWESVDGVPAGERR